MAMLVPNERLDRLDPLGAVELIESITHADARLSGIPASNISFPHNVNAADMGVDGRVEGADRAGRQGAIKKGLTCYQIKSGKFQPTPTNIRRMLYNKKALKEKIRECFDKGGTFVLALTGYDDPNPEDKVLRKIRQNIGDEYKDSEIEIWTQSTIRGFLEDNPSLALQVLGMDDGSFKSYKEWSEQDDMSKKMVMGPQQKEFIGKVRFHLKFPSGKHLRITAEPGIGKTRLVLEALKPFSTACIYVDRPSLFVDSKSFRHILEHGGQVDTHLVVDECDEDYMTEIWNRVKRVRRIALVTIHNEPGTNSKSMASVEVPHLDDEHITSILESYGVPRHRRIRYGSMCGRSPRAAHAIGESLRHEPDAPGDVHAERVWDLYISSKTRRDSDEFKTRKTILLWVSAFRRIGFAGPHSKEYGLLQKHLAEHEGISLGVFTSTIEKLRGMRILQGDATLYITPKILHLKLWGQWYRQYHNMGLALPGYRPEDIEMFSPEANMLKWHTDMFRYAEEAGTNRFTDDLFARDGYADTYRLLDSAVGAEMFHSMAGADIDGAVDCIDRYIRSKTESELLKFRDGRRDVVMILWGASMKSHLFDKSAKLLRLLAEADDDPGRLAEDVFVSLFVPLPDAQTEVPPAARLHLIRDAHLYVNEKRRLLAVRACAEALTRPALIYSYDGDLCRDGKPWTPRSETEISEYYKEVLGILHKHLDYVRGDEEEANVMGIILEKGMNMLADPAVSDTVVDIVKDAYNEHQVNAETIMRAISTRVSINPFRPPSESFLKEAGRLQDMLIGSDYRLLLKRTVSWSRVRDSGDPLNSLEQLARRSLDIDTLRPELAWLVTDEAVRGYDFGHTLGRLDDFGLLPEILNAQKQSKSPNVDFLAGYLRAVFKRDAGKWEGVMDELLQDHDLRACVPEAASLSGITDNAAVRLHDAIRDGHLEPSALKPFIHSNLVNELSEPVFQKWLGLLQGGDVASRQTCINLYWLYYVANKRRIPDSARNLLLSGDAEVVASDQTHMSFWCEILEGYVRQNPGDTEVLSGTLAFASANLAGSGSEDTFYDLLCIVADKSPDEAWGYVAALLDAVPAADSDRAKPYFVANLLQGGGLIDKISPSVIYGWIDGAVERRAPLAAYVLPDSMDIAAEMITRYGGIGTVREVLTSRQVRPRMWSYDVAKKIEELKSFRNEATEPSVLEWIGECIGAMGGD